MIRKGTKVDGGRHVPLVPVLPAARAFEGGLFNPAHVPPEFDTPEAEKS